jgi:hypothetical protein
MKRKANNPSKEVKSQVDAACSRLQQQAERDMTAIEKDTQERSRQIKAAALETIRQLRKEIEKARDEQIPAITEATQNLKKMRTNLLNLRAGVEDKLQQLRNHPDVEKEFAAIRKTEGDALKREVNIIN